MAVVFSNNGKTTLAANVSSSATSISVADGSVFPSLGSGEVFFCTFDDGTNNEIVKVTAISSNTLTVVRAQESTTARAFSAGDAAELRLTAGILSLFTQTGSSIDDEIEAYLDANGLTLPDSVQAQFGNSNDLKIRHSTNSFIENYTGNLRIINYADDSDITFESDDGSGGLATYFYLDGSQQNTNFAKDIIFGDNKKALFGGSGDLQIYHTGNHSYISDAGTGNLYIRADSLDLRRYANAEQYLTADANGAVSLFYDGSKTFETISGGASVAGKLMIPKGTTGYEQSTDYLYIGGNDLASANAAIYIGNRGDGTGYGYRLFYEGTGSGNLNKFKIRSENLGSPVDALSFTADGEATFGDDVILPDSKIIKLGTGLDLQIYHNGTNSFINNDTGDLFIKNFANDEDIVFQCDDGSGGVATYFQLDGSQAQSRFLRNVKWDDSIKAIFGGSDDLQIYHNGTDSVIDNLTGDLYLTNKADDKDIVIRTDDGSGGFTTYMQFDGSDSRILTTKDMRFSDSAKALFGFSNDLQIYHDGSNSYISESGTGGLILKSGGTMALRTPADENMIHMTANGAVNLYYDNSAKLATLSTGISVSGKLSVSSDANDALVIGSGNESITFGGWDSGQSDISGLLAGSNFGSLITGGTNGHVVVGLRDNDVNDSFSVVSGAGDYMTGTTYDKLAFQVNTDGITTTGNRLDVKSQGTILQKWFGGSTEMGRAVSVSGVQMAIGTLDSGIIFNASSNAVYPWDVGNNAGSNNLLDLGISTRQWKNFYLAGNIYIGGENFRVDEDDMSSNSATRVPSQQSVKAYVDAEVASIVDSAPGALNTLNELAAALGDDANFATTTSTSLGNRLRVDTASQGLTATQQANAITNLGITATKAELNVLDGYTGGLTELNYLDSLHATGVTATEFDYLDGVTSNIQTQLNSKLSGINSSQVTTALGYTPTKSSSANYSVWSQDNRNTNEDPEDLNRGLYVMFKNQSTIGLSASGTYAGVLHWRSYGAGSDLSGGDPIRIAYAEDGQLYKQIGTNATTWGSWYKIWDAANDGSGSGLDADLLDGQHGSHYLNYNNLTNKPTIPTNNNQLTNGAGYITSFDITTQTDPKYLRSNAGDTASGTYIFSRTSTTPVFDISGHAGAANYNYFMRAGNDTYSTAAVHFVNGSTRTADHGANAYVIRNDNGTFVLGRTSQSTKIYGSGDLTFNDNEVWHAGNDGAGSSLDADLLDGQHGSYYLNYNNLTNKPTIPTNNNQLTNGAGYITSSGNTSGTAGGLSGTPNITVGTLNATEFSGHIEAGGHLDFNVGANHGTTGNADRWWISQHSTGQSDVPASYVDVINLSSNTVHGLQLAVRYASNDDMFWIRSRSDNSGAPAGTGLQAWKRLFHEDHHPNADKLTTARTIAGTSFDGSANIDINYNNLTNLPTIPSLSGYATESYVTTQINNLIDSAPGALNTLNELAAAIGDDASFSTTITNSIAAKLPLAGGTMSGDITMSGNDMLGVSKITLNQNPVGTSYGGTSSATPANMISQVVGSNDGWRLYGEGASNDVQMIFEIIDDLETGDTWIFRNKKTYSPYSSRNEFIITGEGTFKSRGVGYVETSQRVFADNYHPNADKWTTARTLSLSGDASGSVSWDGSANATLSVAVADDSHNHVISNVDGLQTALDAKLTSSSNLNASNLSSGTVATARLPEFIEERFIYNSNDTNGVYMPMVKGGMYSTGESSVTGAIKIKIPDTMDKDNNMMQFYVDIYEYTTGESMTFRISGYTYNNQTWYNTSVVNLSDDTDRDFTVRFYGNETNDTSYVAIGETNSTWAYPQVNVRDWFSGYNTSEAESQGTWEISFVTSFDGTLRQTHNNNFPAVEVGNINGLTSTVTELNYTDGVTSNIQTQLNAKLASSSYTASDVLTKIKTVDGSGSGLDADLLDGQHGSYYAPISSPSFSSKITTPQIHNSNVISVLNGSSAQGMKVASIYAGTSYSNSAPSGMVNALNGFQVGNTTVINSSRQLDNIDSITITGQASGGTVLGLENNSWVSLKDNGGTLQRVLGASSNTLYVGDVDADFTNMYLRGPSTMYVQTNNTTALTIDSSQVATFANDIVIPDRINHAGDTDTYMQFSAANVWRVVAAGSQVIKATGTTFEVDKTLHAESGIIAFGTSPVITSRASDSEIVLKSQNESASNADQFHIAHQAGNVQLYNARGNMRYYMGSNSATYIEGDGDYAEVNTAYGYTRIGAANANYSHFYTDRNKFYFNKTVQVDGDILPHSNDTRDLGSTAQAFKELHVEDIRFHNANGAVGGIGQYNAAGDIEILSDHNIVFKETDGNAIKAVFGLNGPNFTFGQTTENTSYRVYVNGSIASTADVTAYASDERLKTNIVEIDNPIEKVKQLRGVTFDWQDDVEEKGFEPAAKHETGVIAQEIQKVIPDAVVPAPFDPDYLTVKHEKIVPLLIEAIKEQQKEIEELKQHSHKPRNLDEMEGFDTLVEQINSLKDEIKKLKGEE